MIKLNNLNKYFNRNQKNEIHVINDITLNLPEKGLVVLLGPSGSGKTTLLNVLGGLDKLQSGSITFDDEEISRYKSKVWDKIRNKNVGYIFQNYNLLNNLTVYDNIALTLNMVGVVDKEEIDKRIDYILSNMGMINYRKRRASQLSGGQQQRVAIARALAKNPKVIIADEPTGNLDSKNTVDIMNIIKKISATKLVVLVTHEQELADFYADRVITLKDGSIVGDYENRSSGDLNLQHDTDIYLKDLEQLTDTSDNLSSFKIYTDELVTEAINVTLIVKNKTLYLDVDSKEFTKIKLLGKDSEVKIFDRHFEKVTKENLDESTFNLEAVSSEEKTIVKHSVISIKESIKYAFNRIAGASNFGKVFYFAFAAGAILIAIAVGMLANVYNFDPARFLTRSKDTVIVDYKDFTYAEVLAFEDEASIDYVNLINGSLDLTYDLPIVFQNNYNNNSISAIPLISDYLSNSDIIVGRNVQAYNEIVIDQVMVKAILESYNFNNLGITTTNDLMNVEIIISLEIAGESYQYPLTIVGVSDTSSPTYYLKEATMYMAKTRLPVYEVFADQITLTDGVLPTNKTQILMFDDPDLVGLPLVNRQYMVYGELHTSSGIFSKTSEDVPNVLVTLESLKELLFDTTYNFNGAEMVVISNSVDDTVQYFTDDNIKAVALYETMLANYREDRLVNSLPTIIFTLVVLAASCISYYFIIRSSLISRIYEVSVYRALGVTKNDIRKMFVTEIIIISSITSVLGYLGTSFILLKIQNIAEDYFEFIHVSALSIFAGLALIYGINILSGLIPVSNLLRRTPSEILSKYDF